MGIEDNLAAVKAAIAQALLKAGERAGAGRLIAVSKTREVSDIQQALECGQRRFGENRVQEALRKFPLLKERYEDLELHLIGPLQTNKVRDAVGLFDVIETVDRPKLAAALAKEMARQGRNVRLFVQVNVGCEPQKAGVLPEDLGVFLDLCRQTHKLKISGLMCIPPYGEDAEPYFQLLQDLAQRFDIAELSMGMSGDYPIAIAHGADYVRVGTAIFGVRC